MYLNANIFSVESLSTIINGLLKMGYRCLFLIFIFVLLVTHLICQYVFIQLLLRNQSSVKIFSWEELKTKSLPLFLFPLQSLSLPAAGQWEGERKPSRADRALLSGTAGPCRLWQHQERSHPCAYVSAPPHIAPVSLGHERLSISFCKPMWVLLQFLCYSCMCLVILLS